MNKIRKYTAFTLMALTALPLILITLGLTILYTICLGILSFFIVSSVYIGAIILPTGIHYKPEKTIIKKTLSEKDVIQELIDEDDFF